MVRERSRYLAVMPEAAQGRRRPRERARKRDAYRDLADGVACYLRHPDRSQQDPAAWAAWALRLGAGISQYLPGAPDGSQWHVTTRIDYV